MSEEITYDKEIYCEATHKDIIEGFHKYGYYRMPYVPLHVSKVVPVPLSLKLNPEEYVDFICSQE